MSGLAALASGGDPNGRKFATMNQSSVLEAMGFRRGLRPVVWISISGISMVARGVATSGDIGGVAVEMGGGAGGNGKIGGAAAPASHPQYTTHHHIPLGELVAFDYFNALPH